MVPNRTLRCDSAARQQVRPRQQPKMSSLELIRRGPWSSCKPVMWKESGGEGPDYDPGVHEGLVEGCAMLVADYFHTLGYFLFFVEAGTTVGFS